MAQVQQIAPERGTGADEYKLVAAASADVPSHVRHDPQQRLQFFVETTRDLLAQGKFRGRQAILALPAASMFIQHLRMAKMAEDEIKKALPWEARGQLPIDPSRALLRHIIAGDVHTDQEPKSEVILLAAARAFVEQLISSASRAKLDIIGMNVEPKALIDCFSVIYRRKADAESTSLFVDIGCASTRAIIAQGRQIFFVRSIAIGGDHFNQAAASALATTFEDAKMLRMQSCFAGPALDDSREKREIENTEAASADNSFALLGAANRQETTAPSAPEPAAETETSTAVIAKPEKPSDPKQQVRIIEQSVREPLGRLVEELNLCRRYHEATFSNRPVDRLIFVGGEARQRSLCAHIAREMGLAAQVGDPLVRMGRISEVGIESGIDRRQPQPNWAVAIGLSIGPGVVAPEKASK
jgi:type IV pilus assembly protein PilM